MRYGAKTDKGMMRQQNEDNFCMANLPDMPFSLFAVADGVGGHKAGEVASEIAAEVFARKYQACHESQKKPEAVEFLQHTSQEANEEIIRQAYGSEHTDMGTTLVASAVTDREIITINFGDSRAYLYSQGKLRQLTVDHTIYAEFVRSGQEIPLYDAIEKMTSFPASRIGLKKKGNLRIGSDADILIFDPDRICDHATFDRPMLPPTGISHVLLGGAFAIRDGSVVNDRLGRSVRRS